MIAAFAWRYGLVKRSCKGGEKDWDFLGGGGLLLFMRFVVVCYEVYCCLWGLLLFVVVYEVCCCLWGVLKEALTVEVIWF